MTTTTLSKPTAQIPPHHADLAQRVRLARRLLQGLLLGLVGIGLLATLLGYQAVRTTLDNYYQIVQEGSVSADAAQDAREALLAYHSAAADFLTLDDPARRAERQAQATTAWSRYQEAMRRSWENRSDRRYGEFAVFDAADRASWRYSGEVNAMFAFAAAGEDDRAAAAFREANTTLVQRLIPALNGMERVKIESMEDAYASTSDEIQGWANIFGLFGGLVVLGLVAAVVLTRVWLHYRWTWQITVALVVGLILFGWFLFTLLNAASQVQVMVRDAYDTISGVQSVKALATQADALESVAIFDAENAAPRLRDYDQYRFLLEQQLCGERDCWQRPFVTDATSGGAEIDRVDAEVVELALEGKSKYGLPRTPLIANVHFRGEAAALETMRQHLANYLAANGRLRAALAAGEVTQATAINQTESAEALAGMLAAADQERAIARAEFERIWDQVRTSMQWNLWLTVLFTGVAALGAWGLAQRRQHLFP